MSEEAAARRSRRNILAAALGAVGAAVATTLGRPEALSAASGDPLIVGNASNGASAPTVLGIGGNPIVAAFRVDASDIAAGQTAAVVGTGYAGPGVVGVTTSGEAGTVGVRGIGHTGVMGSMDGGYTDAGAPAGVYGVGLLNGGSGVVGQGFAAPAVLGKGTGTMGVMGTSDSSGGPAVHGWSLYQTGVSGYVGTSGMSAWAGGPDGIRGVDDAQSTSGRGVYGYSKVGTGVVAEAASTGVGLRVIGKAAFSRSGRLGITASHSSVSKTLAGVTTSSLIIAVLQTYRSGVYVAAAVPASGKFTIYLNKAVTATTYVAYFVIN